MIYFGDYFCDNNGDDDGDDDDSLKHDLVKLYFHDLRLELYILPLIMKKMKLKALQREEKKRTITKRKMMKKRERK